MEQGSGAADALPSVPVHADRVRAQAETHERPIMPLVAPVGVRRLAFMREGLATGDDSRLRTAVVRLATQPGPAPDPAARRLSFGLPGGTGIWERHNEFETLTWTSSAGDGAAWPVGLGVDPAAFGGAMVAVRVDVTASGEIAPQALRGFDELSLCYSSIEGERAEIATDFRDDRAGFTRYELAVGGMGPVLCGSVVRRVLEIETYRILALLGLPLAREGSSELDSIENGLGEAMRRMKAPGSPQDGREALGELHALQVRAVDLVERNRSRFAASQAYGGILRRRLSHLDERARGEHRTLMRFLDHRLEPALATCEATRRRQSALLEQLGRATALLDTQITLDIEVQNRGILETISGTAQSQFRLQSTVEGLSVIAISYYLLGIAGYLLHWMDGGHEGAKNLVLAALVPVVVGAAWMGMRRVKARHAPAG